MNMQLFFLTQDGWFEAELTEKLLHVTAEDLIRWAYAMMERNHYRNYRIMEGPLSCPLSFPEKRNQMAGGKTGMQAPAAEFIIPNS